MATTPDDLSPMDAQPHTTFRDTGMILALIALGAILRISGFTTLSLWFDDAWSAMPAKASLGEAVHMVVTTPLYTLGMREWILLGPHATWWAQIPAFVLGLAGIPALWMLGTMFGLPRRITLLMATVIAVSPITMTYSLRVKEYSADLLLACVLLALAERWRRNHSTRTLVALVATACLSIAISASTAVVIAAVVIMLVWTAHSERNVRRQLLLGLGIFVIVSGIVWAIWLRHVPRILFHNWREHGFLLDFRGFHPILFSTTTSGAGILHGLLGLPVAWNPSKAVYPLITVTTALIGWTLVCASLVVALRGSAPRKGQQMGAMFVPAAAVLLNIILWAIDKVPFGSGRTDEVLYPALLLLLGNLAVVTWKKITSLSRIAVQGPTSLMLASVIALGLVAIGASHRPTYPGIDFSKLKKELFANLKPGQYVVVDGFVSFPWAYAGVSPTSISFTNSGIPWPQNFHVMSNDPRIVMSQSYLTPDDQILTLSKRTHHIWFVNATNEAYSNAVPTQWRNLSIISQTLNAMTPLGWEPYSFPIAATGIYAQAYGYR